MQQALYGDEGKPSSSKGLSQWAELPGLCCQAAGGRPEWADGLTVAWLLFYSAADIMDKVQDGDEPAVWWRELGAGAALSAASGLYFSASLALNQLADNDRTRSVAAEITQDLYSSFLEMTSGQYADLVNQSPTLEQYWKFIGAKSGGFFALACRAAARLVDREVEHLENFGRYGHHLGMLVQILDDLEDVLPMSDRVAPGQRHELAHSLPVIYVLSILPDPECEELKRYLSAAPVDEFAAAEVIRILNENNAALYLAAEMEKHRGMALDAIRSAARPSPARDALEAYLHKF
jgi:geranylgeranyl pyrophosphate synthase